MADNNLVYYYKFISYCQRFILSLRVNLSPVLRTPVIPNKVGILFYTLQKCASEIPPAIISVCGFIAQLVEQRTGNAEVTGSNPVEALIFFFRLLLSNCLNWKQGSRFLHSHL